MSVAFQYKVVSVNKDAGCMDVEFKSDGLPDVLVGVRIPFEGEDVDEVIQSFAPLSVWQPLIVPTQEVSVGHEGAYAPAPAAPDENAVANSELWAQVNFEKAVAKTLVKFGVVEADPTEIAVTTL